MIKKWPSMWTELYNQNENAIEENVSKTCVHQICPKAGGAKKNRQSFVPLIPIVRDFFVTLLTPYTGGVGFNQHCHKISTVLHHIGFRSTSLLLFTLNIFNISTVFTLNELSSPLFFHQHGFQSTLFSLNTAYHLH